VPPRPNPDLEAFTVVVTRPAAKREHPQTASTNLTVHTLRCLRQTAIADITAHLPDAELTHPEARPGTAASPARSSRRLRDLNAEYYKRQGFRPRVRPVGACAGGLTRAPRSHSAPLCLVSRPTGRAATRAAHISTVLRNNAAVWSRPTSLRLLHGTLVDKRPTALTSRLRLQRHRCRSGPSCHSAAYCGITLHLNDIRRWSMGLTQLIWTMIGQSAGALQLGIADTGGISGCGMDALTQLPGWRQLNVSDMRRRLAEPDDVLGSLSHFSTDAGMRCLLEACEDVDCLQPTPATAGPSPWRTRLDR
jgi:hypothetical protein